MKKKKGNNELVKFVASTIPYILLVLVVFPILGRLSFSAYTSFAVSNSVMTNRINVLVIIFANILVLLSLLYVFNQLIKFNWKKYILIGIPVFIYTLSMAIYKYSLFSSIKIESKETVSPDAILKLNDFKTAKAILIAFIVYFIITLLLNRIAVVSIKNKKK